MPSQRISFPDGTRIQFQSHTGTVKYTGLLENHGETLYHGIEWDDPSRGRHSGSVEGHTYFTPSVPGSCTFLKSAKLGTGGRVSFSEAVQRRYLHDAIDSTHRTRTQVIGGGHVSIENGEREKGVGEVIDVSGMGVGWIGDIEGMDGVREVYLARSLVGAVEDVIEVLRKMGGLKVLDVSRNVLQGVGEGVHHGLTDLILNYCKINWEGVKGICEGLKELRELRVYGCGLEKLTRWDEMLLELQVADFGKNKLKWNEVVEILGRLPKLKELYLTENELGDCQSLKEAAEEGKFAHLHILGLGDNGIREWSTISALDSLPNLSKLRLRGNAILDAENDGLTGRMQTIARVAQLEVLDGSTITTDERRYAERRYVRWAHRSSGGKASLEHPRFTELASQYGIDDGVSTSRGMIHVTMSVEGQDSSISRPIPLSTPLEKVHRIARRLLHVTTPTNVIFGHSVDVSDTNRELSFWANQGGLMHLILKPE